MNIGKGGKKKKDQRVMKNKKLELMVQSFAIPYK